MALVEHWLERGIHNPFGSNKTGHAKKAIIPYNRYVDVSEPIVFMSVRATGQKRKRTRDHFYQNPVINALLKNTYDLSHRLIKVVVNAEAGKVTDAEISLWNEDAALHNHPVIQKGTIITLVWGYPGLVTKPRSFRVQKIKGQRSRVRSMGVVTIKATAQGQDMNAQPISKAFRNRSAREVADRIRKEWGFVTKKSFVGPDDNKKQDWFQTNQTDFQFLSMIAQQKGWQFSAEDGEMLFGPEHRNQRGKAVVAYVYYLDNTGWVKRFEPETNSLNRTGKTTVKGKKKEKTGKVSKTIEDEINALSNRFEPIPGDDGDWLERRIQSQRDIDERNEELIAEGAYKKYKEKRAQQKAHRKSGKARPGVIPSTTVVPTAMSNQQKMSDEAKVRQHNMQMAGAKARLVVIGDPLLWKNVLVHMSGVEGFMNGLWRVRKCKHVIDKRGYEVECLLRRDGENKKGAGKKKKKKQSPKSKKKKARVARPVETFSTGYTFVEKTDAAKARSVQEKGYASSSYHHRR